MKKIIMSVVAVVFAFGAIVAGAGDLPVICPASGGVVRSVVTVPMGQMWAFKYQQLPAWIASMSAYDHQITPSSWGEFGASCDYDVSVAFELQENKGEIRCWDYHVRLKDTDVVVKTLVHRSF